MTDWDVLGLAPGASADEVKRAYRAKAHLHHPDHGGDPAKFRAVHDAYERLKDGGDFGYFDMSDVLDAMQRGPTFDEEMEDLRHGMEGVKADLDEVRRRMRAWRERAG